MIGAAEYTSIVAKVTIGHALAQLSHQMMDKHAPSAHQET